MRVHLILIVYLMAALGAAQTQESGVIASVTTVPIEEGSVTAAPWSRLHDFSQASGGDQAL